MEIREIFRVAKWLDNNLVTKFRDNSLNIGGLDTEKPAFILDHPTPSNRL